MDDTLLKFGSAKEAVTDLPASGPRATVCTACGQHFAAEGRFCPFDGEPLSAAFDWEPPSDPMIGTVVDNRYEVCSVLGEGGMGIVYEARHRALGKRFALKALRKDLTTDGEIAARFIQEARTAASVSHPGLVEITDFGALVSGQPFFVMELLEGQSLATLIRRGGAVPGPRTLDIVRQLAEALGAAHEASIVHRDLKPDNIHVSTDDLGRDRVKIVDFGLAKVIGARRLTRAGVVFGTPHYMSPEQAMGEVTDHRADIYALGVVIYEMLSGRVPFEADSYMGVLTKHMYMAPVPLPKVSADEQISVLEAVMLRCLQKKPEHRYATLRELIVDLERVPADASPLIQIRPLRRTLRSVDAQPIDLPNREPFAANRCEPQRTSLPGWHFLLIATLFVMALLSVLAVRRKRGNISVNRPGLNSSVADDGRRAPTASVASASSPTVSVASASSLPSVSGTRENDGAAPALASRSPAALATRGLWTAQSVALPVPAPPAPGALPARLALQVKARALGPVPASPSAASAASGSRKPIGLGPSEIVDPWAK